MRIGVFFSVNERDTAESLIRTLCEHGKNEVRGYLVEKGWEKTDGQEMQFQFSHLHLFIIVSGTGGNLLSMGSWVPFLLGFVMGTESSLCFYAMKPVKPVSVYRHFPVLYGRTELEHLIDEEYRIWQQDRKIQHSREFLIDLGIGLNEENLARRVVLGDAETVEAFMVVGFSPDARDPTGTPLLVLAIRNGNDALVESLIGWGADVNAASDDRGSTPIMEAAIRGSKNLVEKLIEAGAYIDSPSKNGQTALMLAVGEGHDETAVCLIDSGADVEIADQLGMTAAKYAALFGHTAIVEAIEKRKQAV